MHRFDPNTSYLISGGLGGLGRSISRWMASKGARNLILLSRSGNTKDSSKALVADLEAMGVRVATPPCDVTDASALKAALDQSHGAGMPPVKGCIQGSMVLKVSPHLFALLSTLLSLPLLHEKTQDSLLSNMTLEDYYTTVKPKVDASWNLHDVLPKGLDFFVLLSSISTVWGNRGQANYIIGNAFQDALARYRVRHGWRARAVDVGMILSAGYVAENKALNITPADIDPGKPLHDNGRRLARLGRAAHLDPEAARRRRRRLRSHGDEQHAQAGGAGGGAQRVGQYGREGRGGARGCLV